MRYLLPIILLLVAGCNTFEDDNSLSLECDVAPFKYVKSEKPMSCRNFSINVAVARDLMIDRGWVKDEAEFNTLYSSVAVEIVDRKCISGPSIFELIPLHGCIYGYYSQNDNYWRVAPQVRLSNPIPEQIIGLNWDARALGHELMHHYDYTHGRRDLPKPHYFWTSLGYYAYADDYANMAFLVE